MDVSAVRGLIREYVSKPGNSVGGSLHIVIEDGNTEQEFIRFCRQWALDREDSDGVRLADVLLSMTMAERASALGFSE